MCGDSTKAEDVQKLMNGEQADLLLTDPPYNVALGIGDSAVSAKKRHRRQDGLKIQNDSMTADEFIDFLESAFTNAAEAMKPGAAFYCWYASSSQKEFQLALENAELFPHQNLIWVKSSLVLGRQDYQWRHEPCFYGWKEGAAHYFIDVRSFTTVSDNLEDYSKEQAIKTIKDLCSVTTTLYEDKPNKSELHPTMKPLNLIKKQIRNSSREGDIVLDIFGGSGTTLIACEEMNRKCRMMELDEKFASSIIKRWEKQTGEAAERIQ